MDHKPPELAEKILTKLQYDDVWKTTLGDFEEYHAYLSKKNGPRAADWWYWKQVFRYAPSKIIHSFYWTLDMFRNYLKVAIRNILKYRGYSFINILGLAIGLASFVLIGLFVVHEMSYDRQHEDSDKIYRVVRNDPQGFYLGTNWYAVNPTPLSLALNDDFQGIEAAVVLDIRESLLSTNNQPFFEDGLFTNESYFDFFSYDWLAGNPATSLENPNSIVLTRSLAEKYFGESNAMGEAILFTYDDEEPFLRTVTGIIEDVPSNTHLQFDFVAPMNSMPGYERESTFWLNNNTYSYIKIDGTVSPSDLVDRIKALSDPQLLTSDYYSENPQNLPFFALQPLKDVYLKSGGINFNPGKISSARYVYMLSGIAIIILIIACINYMNLATARSMNRAKEIGVRKVNGAFQSNLIMQFVAEALVFSLAGLFLALVIVITLFPTLSASLGQSVSLQIFNTPLFWALFIGIGTLVGLISGSYPALYMSGLSPIGVFKKTIKGGSTNRRMRNLLVVGQFAITNILVLSSVVIFQQLNYIQSKDAGFNRDQIVTIEITDPEVMPRFDVLKQSFSSNPNILSVSSGSHLPTKIESQTSGINWDGKPEDYDLDTFNGIINTNYLEMLGVDMIAGRYFDEEMDPDTANHLIINESLARSIGWSPEEAVGKDFILWRRDGRIVGVVQDFNFMSYHSSIAPLLLRYAPIEQHSKIMLKISPNNMQETLRFVEDEIRAISPDFPFIHAFLDDTFDNQYRTELTLGKMFNYFTILALFIACMGLFGLASFMMEQRSKEIGIRKVLGANLLQIITLLNRDFIKLIGISLLISIPVGWFLANNWLKDFAYRIDLGPMIFISTAVIALGVALLTVSIKSFKTATANPIDSLKSE
ncbi:MAG: ABC transporter permease [Balneola sp.]|nr:MAG: ABC transporter permease [Balneola sp.]